MMKPKKMFIYVGDQGTEVLHFFIDHRGNTKWLLRGMTFTDQLFVAWLKNMQVEILTGVHNN
jgi:hypothetical protein